MERFDSAGCGRASTFWTWGLYALAVLLVDRAIAAHGLPESAAWVLASVMGLAVLVWTREI